MIVPKELLQHHMCRLARDIGAALTHRNADIGLFQCRGVIHAVTCHRDDVAALLIKRRKLQLGCRRDAGKDVSRKDAATQGIVGRFRIQVGQFIALDHHQRAALRTQSGLSGDGSGGVGMIARHHRHAHTCRAGSGDGPCDIAAQGVAQADHPDQRQILIRGFIVALCPLHRQGQQAQPFSGGGPATIQPIGAQGGVQVLNAVRAENVAADRDHRLRGALDRIEEPACVTVHACHHLGVLVKCVLAHFFTFRQQHFAALTRLSRNAQQRQFHRVA